MKLIGGGVGGGVIHKPLGHAKSTLEGILKTPLTKIEAHEGMSERLVRDLYIEDALQILIKAKLSHNNQSYVQMVCSIIRGKK